MQALQDLLELDGLFECQVQDSPDVKDKSPMIKDYLSKVRSRLKQLPRIAFPSDCEWFNCSQPWTGDDLQGQVTLLDFWTYCCINCMQILPDLEALEEAFETVDNVVVIGVHSAKFENERIGKNILNAINRYGIKHPVINDAQALLWQNLSISCWPTVVLLGPDVKPLKFFVGEGHRESMIAFTKAALEFFRDDLVTRKLPKIQVGLHTSSCLKFPGNDVGTIRFQTKLIKFHHR